MEVSHGGEPWMRTILVTGPQLPDPLGRERKRGDSSGTPA